MAALAADLIVIRMEEALALIIAARRHGDPRMLADAIDAAECALLYRGHVVPRSLEARAVPPGPSAGGTQADHAAAAHQPPSPHTPRRPKLSERAP